MAWVFWLLAASAVIEAVDKVVKLVTAVKLTVPPAAAAVVLPDEVLVVVLALLELMEPLLLLAATCITGAWGAKVKLATVVVIPPLVVPTFTMVVRPTWLAALAVLIAPFKAAVLPIATLTTLNCAEAMTAVLAATLALALLAAVVTAA